jgi:hypothetical protein
MTQQYLREIKLVTSKDTSGQGIDLSAFRVVFSVYLSDSEKPNEAIVRIYNLDKTTTDKIRLEYDRITLAAGYKENSGLIFDGVIKQAKKGEENSTDLYIEITASDGDLAYNDSFVSASILKGSDQDQIAKKLAESSGLPIGFKDELENKKLSRGKVLHGAPKKYLRKLADTNNASWSIQNGKLQIVKLKSVIPNQAVLVSTATGLIGYPEIDIQSIKFTTLLNPKYSIAGRIKLDLGLDTDAFLNADGLYRVYEILHTGDTHGNNWYSEITALDIDATQPPETGTETG